MSHPGRPMKSTTPMARDLHVRIDEDTSRWLSSVLHHYKRSHVELSCSEADAVRWAILVAYEHIAAGEI